MRVRVRQIVFAIICGCFLGLLTLPVVIPLFYAVLNGSGMEQVFMPFFTSDGFNGLVSYWRFYYADNLLSDASTNIIWIGICVLLLVCGCLFNSFRIPKRKQKDGTFGAQTSESRVGKILKRCFTWDGSTPEHSGFVVGYARKNYVITPAIHAVFCAPSGSYKTRASVLPSAGCITYTGENNLVVTDPSLEIYCYTHNMLERRGYNIFLIDLENPYRGARINFLSSLIKLHNLGMDFLVEERCQEIGSLLFPEQGNDADAFSQPAAGLVAAVSYIVATDDVIPNDARHLYTVIRIILEGTTGESSAPFKDWLRSFGSDSPAVGMAASFLSATDRYEASIVGTLHNGLRPFNTTAMRYLISENDFDADDFLKSQSVLFLHTLSPGNPANKIASLLLAQLWSATERNGQRRGSNRPTYYLLDECHSIPPFGLPTILEQSRKYDCHFSLYLQSFSGLDAYKTNKEDGKDAILSNCDCKCLFRAGNDSDAQYFERLSGKATYLSKNIGESRNSREKSANTGYSEKDRPVWMAGDILQRDPLKDGVLVFQNPTNYPEMLGKYEIPIEEPSKVPFLVEEYGTIGTKQHEEQIIAIELDNLDSYATDNMNIFKQAVWVPPQLEAEELSNSDISDEALFGLD